ncbi:FecCD family ABC transporter permease [Occultella kanbiaonis]|uniref:FecCD family ABC transporter permease n=1 Tax=Occultella kanbiaonis TaxID=2675754 RepID=UPI001A9A2947|nr:iron chelate uptake ABC transporter family permease subunit [Occultella kanbiaonis]
MSELGIRILGGRVSGTVRSRALAVGLALLAVCVVATAASLALGRYTVSIPDILAVLTGGGSDDVRRVVWEWRMPRALAAVALGCALGASGALFQSLTRNPLGSPDIIGFNMGAYTGVLITMLLGAVSYAAIAGGALFGGTATALAVYALARRNGLRGFRLIVIGIGVSALLGSVNTWIVVKGDLSLAMQAAVWGAGSLNGVTWAQVGPSVVCVGLLLLLAGAMAPHARQLELGDDSAAARGIHVERLKGLIIVTGAALTAVVTAVAGPIGFIALAAPQLAHRMVGRADSLNLPLAALMGAALLSVSDIVALHAFGVALPVGAVTVCIGGAYLVWLLARETGR